MGNRGNAKNMAAQDAAPAKMGRVGLWVVVLLGLAMGSSASLYWWFFLKDRVTTDNAYVMADVAKVSPRVPGTVRRVLVENDQPVETGQVLLELDPTDYQVALERAEASVARIEAEIRAAEALLSMMDKQTAAQVEAARTLPPEARDKRAELTHRLSELKKKRDAALAEFKEAERDKERFESLFAARVVSERSWEQIITTYHKAKASLEATEAEIEATKAAIQAVDKTWSRAKAQVEVAQSDRDQVEVQRHRLDSLRAQMKEALAAREAARLNLSYCYIKAPISGYVAQKNVQVGEQLQAGQPVMAIVPLNEVYVEANFKETQLTNVRIGQLAEIKADMYPGHSFKGRVIGIRAGTGAVFSLLPPENATGNWIKVVQRVPVKIALYPFPTDKVPLRLGTSLKVTIHTHDRSGPALVGKETGS